MLTVLLALVAGTMCAAKVQIGSINYNLDPVSKKATVVSLLKSKTNYLGLKTANIPATVKHEGITYEVTTIGQGAFKECKTLTNVTIAEGVTKINEDAFKECANIESVSFPSTLTFIGSDSFSGCSGLTSVVIPDKVTTIGGSAFSDCSNLETVTISSSVIKIEGGAFSDCRNLAFVEIHTNAIVSVDYKADDGLVDMFGPQVKEYVLGNEITRIGNHAFYNCTGLQKITIGANVEEMGNYAFENCKNIDVIICNAKNAPLLTKRTFKNMGNKAYVYIYVPEGRERSYKRDQFWGEFDIYTQGTEPKGDKED